MIGAAGAPICDNPSRRPRPPRGKWPGDRRRSTMTRLTRWVLAGVLTLIAAAAAEASGCRQGWRDLDGCSRDDDDRDRRGDRDGDGQFDRPVGHPHRPRPVPQTFYPRDVELGRTAPPFFPYVPPSFLSPAARP